MIDAHVHIGQFYSQYYDPQKIFSVLNQLNVNQFVFSSTSSCIDNVDYKIIENEINIIFKKYATPDEAKVLFWAIPDYMIKHGFNKNYFDNLPYSGVKIHPRAHNWDLSQKKTIELVYKMFDYALEKKFPILLHTGYDKIDEATKFEMFFKIYKNIKFVLAHGRPIEQIKAILLKYQNVFVDTAFMPYESIIDLLNNNYYDRIIFGTDFPITHYFSESILPEGDLIAQYKKDLNIKNLLGDKLFQKIQINTERIWFQSEKN